MGDFQEGKRAIKARRGNGPLRRENGPLRRGNAPLTLMGSFRAPHHGRKRPPLKRPIKRSMNKIEKCLSVPVAIVSQDRVACNQLGSRIQEVPEGHKVWLSKPPCSEHTLPEL